LSNSHFLFLDLIPDINPKIQPDKPERPPTDYEDDFS